jgi:phosphinothricin acetyltransferase
MSKDYTQLRHAISSDLTSILRIYNEAIDRTTAIYEYHPFTQNYIESWWRQRIEEQWPVLVIETNGDIAGFATYGTFRARAAYRTTMEHSVYVLESFRGNGFGKQLLAAIVEEARKNNVHVLIGGIDAENKQSIKMHEAAGFKMAGHLHQVAFKFDRWLDLVFMEMIL